jgi:glycosyltransferase involved in cell wall biosynthesis
MIKLSVIIPAYNEKKRLPDTLEKVRKYLLKQDYEYEVIIVDDGSKDQTGKEAKYFIKNWHGFRLISYTPNRGKGFAVKTGMLAARGEYCLLMDADNSTDLKEIEKFWPYKNKFEIIIGSRYLNKDSIKIKQPLMRRIVSRFGNFLIRTTLGIKSVDTQCGFKLFSQTATQVIFPLQQIERWGFDMEILAIAIRKDYKIKEVAVDWYDAEGSQVKKGAAMKTLKELWMIKRNIWAGKY